MQAWHNHELCVHVHERKFNYSQKIRPVKYKCYTVSKGLNCEFGAIKGYGAISLRDSDIMGVYMLLWLPAIF